MKTFIATLVICSATFFADAQDVVFKPSYLNYEMDEGAKELILTSLNSLFIQLRQGKIDKELLSPDKADLTSSILQLFKSKKTKKGDVESETQNIQLINFYPVSTNSFLLTIAFTEVSKEKALSPHILNILRLIATTNKEEVTFSIPLVYKTRHWKTFNIGNVTYHSRDNIVAERARQFNKKNKEIASKLGVEAEILDFFICDNYQEILELLGLEYSSKYNGNYRNGYGVDSNTIFSVMGNEDFSHDIFHYYSGKIHKRKNRNWIAEEGIAYLWGNAYYTDKNGEMITLQKLVQSLKEYLNNNPDVSLFDLFENNPKLFNDIAPEVSVRSTIAGVIAHEIENKKGMQGVIKLINAGNSDLIPNFLSVTDKEIGINKENFNRNVKKLVYNF